jgi:hypothetical protein
VAVEKGAKAVISGNFGACGERTFNNLRTNFAVKILCKEFFNSHVMLRQQPTTETPLMMMKIVSH